MDTWDVVVVGAGPAGSAAALAALRADPTARVLLLDRASFPRDKACGDGVAPHALDVLAHLGVTGLVDGYRPVSRLHLQSPDGSSAVRDMRRPAYVVPRRVFDARLRAAALSAGAEPMRHTVRRLATRGDVVVIDGTIAARALVGADGAESVVRRALGAPATPGGRTAVAVRGYARTPAGDGSAEQLLRLARDRWPAYAWSFPVGDGWSNVGYGEVLRREGGTTRAALEGGLRALLPGHLHELRNLRGHRLPLSTGRPRLRDGRITLAGDAMSMINPLTGEGIYYAVLTGALAGAAAVAGADCARLARRATARRLGPHLRVTGLASRLWTSPVVADAGVRAAARDGQVFDDLVEIGLADGRLSGRTARRLVAAYAR